MAEFTIKKGRDIPLKGAASKEIVDFGVPPFVGIQPSNYKGFRPRLCVRGDDSIKVGTPILADKTIPEIKIVSPVSGKVAAINRGEKRALLEVVIETDGKQEAVSCRNFSPSEIATLSKKQITETLLEGGMWPAIRQRPFSKIANPHETPKSVFIHAMNTEPLALDVDFILKGREKEFQVGLDLIRKLTTGQTHLCIAANAQSPALTQVKNVQIHRFTGPHPTGNVSTHIHFVDPINKGDVVWFVEAQDVLRIANLFLTGKYSPERMVAITGEGAVQRVYAKTILGAPLSFLLAGSDLNGMRCISGSVLAGRAIGKNGFLGYYDSQMTVIPEGGKRELLGWLDPGLNRYTFSKTFLSAFLPRREFSLDADRHGSDRAIVLNHIYDQFVPLDIMTYFLIKAIVGGDIEECERLGILECDEEDFALCTFACPSKTDVGAIVREGLEVIEKEG